MSRVPKDMQDAFVAIVNKKYADQCKWYMNGFWDELERNKADIELIWDFCQRFIKLDQKKAEGCFLDEFWSHKFLEELGETLTAIALREKLRTIDVDNNKKMSIIEYLMFRFNKTVKDIVQAPQGGNKEEMDVAQRMVDASQKAVEEMVALLEAQKSASQAAQEAAASAKRAEEVAVKSEAEAKATAEKSKTLAAESKQAAETAKVAAAAEEQAAAENQAALLELKKQEEAYAAKKQDLEKKTQEGGLVSRNKAANELAQLLAEDPLPLRRAKINQEAAVKKSEKAALAAKEAATKAEEAAARAAEAAEAAAVAAAKAESERQAAVASRVAAESAAAAAENAAREAEAAAAEAEKSLQQAVEFLESVKRKGGVAHGNIWWMEREIAEKKKFLPKRLQ